MSLASSCVVPCEGQGGKKRSLVKGTKSPKQQGEVAVAILPAPRRPESNCQKKPHVSSNGGPSSFFPLSASRSSRSSSAKQHTPRKRDTHAHIHTHTHTQIHSWAGPSFVVRGARAGARTQDASVRGKKAMMRGMMCWKRLTTGRTMFCKPLVNA